MRGLILAIDQGTTNTKALLLGADGQPIFRTSTGVGLITPRAGFVEQDLHAIWQSVQEVILRSLEFAGDRRIEGIAISNQRETAAAWRRSTGEPLANAMSWQCRRSEGVCNALSSHVELIRERTGLPLDPLLSASKWSWLLDAKPEYRALAASGDLCFGTIDAWLIYKLTAGRTHQTDHSNASRTALLNLQSLDWDNDLLTLFNLPRSAMPALCNSSGVIANVESIAALRGVSIVAAIGDSHASLFGHGRFTPGTVKATYGTGSSLMMATRGLPPATKELARTVAWTTADAKQYALEGNITMTGSAIQWVGEFLGLNDPIAEIAALAASVDSSHGVFFVPAMVGLGAPYWDSSVRGAIIGLDRSSTRAHLARAAIESIAFQIADVLYAMHRASGTLSTALYADGGATRNAALMQFQADLLQLPVHRSACEDLSALGAGWLGGLALGWWKTLAEIEALPQEAEIFLPGPADAAKYAAWKLAVAQARLREDAA
ncbi:MAG TPA: FGGY family carbohydrate kinase [Acidobacteriaceae bacterium]|nr:FGGY family carbohydrate kinase [Acidobacteriaceae bacterium]